MNTTKNILIGYLIANVAVVATVVAAAVNLA